MNKAKSNIKKHIAKIVSLIIAFLLWLFVMYDMDPVDERTMNEIPVKIENMDFISSLNLTPKADQKLTVSVKLSGQRSLIYQSIKKLTNARGSIPNPKAGNNIMNVSLTGLDPKVQAELSPEYIEVVLEPIVAKDLPIQIKTLGYAGENSKVTGITIEPSNVFIQGAKSAVEKIKNAVCEVNLNNETSSFSKLVTIKFTDQNGNQTNNAKSTDSQTLATVKISKTKKVPIDFIFSKSGYKFADNFSPEKTEISVEGSSDSIDKINSVKTEVIDTDALEKSAIYTVKLIKPAKAVLGNGEIEIINLKAQNQSGSADIQTAVLEFDASRLQIIGNYVLPDGSSLKDKLDIPDKIYMEINYKQGEKFKNYLDKSNYKLILDLENFSEETGNVPIRLLTQLNYESAELHPSQIGLAAEYDAD